MLFIYFQREGKGGRKRGRETPMWEKNINWLGDWTYNPGMCPDWELNWQPFALRGYTQPTQPHQSGPCCFIPAPQPPFCHYRPPQASWALPTITRATPWKTLSDQPRGTCLAAAGHCLLTAHTEQATPLGGPHQACSLPSDSPSRRGAHCCPTDPACLLLLLTL